MIVEVLVVTLCGLLSSSSTRHCRSSMLIVRQLTPSCRRSSVKPASLSCHSAPVSRCPTPVSILTEIFSGAIPVDGIWHRTATSAPRCRRRNTRALRNHGGYRNYLHASFLRLSTIIQVYLPVSRLVLIHR